MYKRSSGRLGWKTMRNIPVLIKTVLKNWKRGFGTFIVNNELQRLPESFQYRVSFYRAFLRDYIKL